MNANPKANLTQRTEIIFITPELAVKWMGHNKLNRELRFSHITHLSREISEMKWVLNGESIKFDCDNNLIDGQHRLQAIIKAKQGIESYVTWGIDPTFFASLDTGRKRGPSDVLSIRGEKSCALLAAALAIVWTYRRNGNLLPGSSSVRPTNLEILETLDQNAGIRNSIEWGQLDPLKTLIPPGQAVALHFIFSEKSERADEFFQSLNEGRNLSAGNPLLTLREKLFRNRDANAKLRRSILLQFTVKAWNAFLTGTKMSLLRPTEENSNVLGDSDV